MICSHFNAIFFCLQEEWDDSTVSSNISKMRIQNRLEATTRRERALAYAFSQQVRLYASKEKINLVQEIIQVNLIFSIAENLYKEEADLFGQCGNQPRVELA